MHKLCLSCCMQVCTHWPTNLLCACFHHRLDFLQVVLHSATSCAGNAQQNSHSSRSWLCCMVVCHIAIGHQLGSIAILTPWHTHHCTVHFSLCRHVCASSVKYMQSHWLLCCRGAAQMRLRTGHSRRWGQTPSRTLTWPDIAILTPWHISQCTGSMHALELAVILQGTSSDAIVDWVEQEVGPDALKDLEQRNQHDLPQ